jgi:serine/threonine protein kinase
MVTGRRPFDSEAVFALISMQINDKPEPPSTHRSDLPPDLEAIILQALAKHPAQRQESMAVVLSQLELARGNPQASSDALLRARHEQRKVLPFPIRPMPQVQAEISTLRDTAISRGATGRTGHGKGPARWGLYVAGAVAAAALAMYLLAPHGSKAELPQAAAIVSPSAVPSQPAVPLPPPPVEIALNSIPSGAMVYAGELLIGTTPTTYRTEASDKSVEFTFRAEGYAAETIHALPAQGLKITTNLTALAPPKRAIHPTRRMAPGRSARASSEIQIER